MKAFILGLLICGCVLAQEFQLELLHEFEIPAPPTGQYITHPWDVQFWMNDSIPGWTVLRNDTIFYQTDLSQPLQTFVLPTQLDSALCVQFNLSLWGFYLNQSHSRDLYLLRWPSRPDHTVIAAIRMVESDNQDADGAYDYYIIIWDLTDGMILYTKQIQDNYAYGIASAWFSREGTYADMTITPPLPAVTNLISWTVQYTADVYLPGDWHERWSGCGVTIGIITEDTLLFADVPGYARRLGAFARSDPFTFACLHSYGYSLEDGENYESHGWSGFSTVDANGNWTLDSLGLSGKLIAQTDADGTHRIITTSPLQAHSSPDHELLWRTEDWWFSNYSSFSARCGSEDEQIWMNKPDSSYCSIYRASNGHYMGQTSDFLGTPQYMNKSNPDYDQLVTYDNDTHLVRLYRCTSFNDVFKDSDVIIPQDFTLT
ncbi:hypothetical protein KKC97_09705, partial [bacterium]|nr:hypothetical protein [bacterium]